MNINTKIIPIGTHMTYVKGYEIQLISIFTIFAIL